MEKHIEFELAKLLKEKGFDKPVYQYYRDEEKIVILSSPNNANQHGGGFVSAPTIAQVVMWLYEKHGVWIEVRKSYLLHQFVAVTKNPRIELSSKDSPTEAYEAAIKYCLENIIK